MLMPQLTTFIAIMASTAVAALFVFRQFPFPRAPFAPF